jgi:CRP-like cAMP-binding protein
MGSRDFFTFCTSLKRSELRAIGELSWVRHLAVGEILYAPGEPGNALFIVNRGVLEAVAADSPRNSKGLYLLRGDFVGEIEVFSQAARRHLVRAHETASLQCFPRANFAKLVDTVPTFFQYLCEEMASRLLSAPDPTVEQSHCLELKGSMSNFDLATIYQTIASSGQTGELTIKDESAQTVGAFYFETGRPCKGQFQHLTGPDAFWQLFLSDTLAGTFSFATGEGSVTKSIQSSEITRNSGDLLIVALQFRDEFNALKRQLPDASHQLKACAADLVWNGEAPPDLAPLAKQIWELVSLSPRTLTDLYRQCFACELKVYQVVHELLRSEQMALD